MLLPCLLHQVRMLKTFFAVVNHPMFAVVQVELKNLNSFRVVQEPVDFEIVRQSRYLRMCWLRIQSGDDSSTHEYSGKEVPTIFRSRLSVVFSFFIVFLSKPSV